MHTNTFPVANRSIPATVLNRAIEWVRRTGAQFMVSSSCTNPILTIYQSLLNANFWALVHVSREDDMLCFTVSNGVKIPTAWIPQTLEFLDAINHHSPHPLEFDNKDNAIWMSMGIELTEDELLEADIEGAFHTACKLVDDSTAPLLGMIYGNNSLPDAVAAYEQAFDISLEVWRASIEPWPSRREANGTHH